MKRLFPSLLLAVLFLSSTFAYSKEALQVITVKDGQTLWSISNYYLKDPKRWPEILKYNNLPLNDPTVALPGMKLKVPVLLIKEHRRYSIQLIEHVLCRSRDLAFWIECIPPALDPWPILTASP